ncbi:Chromate resistance protein ChrB [Sporolactobacillus sp. KGMB 08714]|uniref:Chromate resistance protein ChrB n=1 Tax=Sporolactobacillus sp. KGMB 08714 TaxID=3064704 RepID=UPI002FBD74ED
MNWITIIYQIPREMHKNRMAVWRKLKSIAALNVLQSIWILPESEAAKSELKALEKQISENGGKSIYCVTVIEDEAQNQKIIDGFNSERKQDFKEFFDKCDDFEHEIKRETERENFTYAEVEENEHEIKKLHIWLNKIIRKDYFDCSFKSEAAERLKKSEDLLSRFSDEVYNRNDE